MVIGSVNTQDANFGTIILPNGARCNTNFFFACLSCKIFSFTYLLQLDNRIPTSFNRKLVRENPEDFKPEWRKKCGVF